MSESNKISKLSRISIQEFIKVFSTIDEQILLLHECSSDDFLGLNADFKKYFHQSKTISENAEKILNELTASESVDLLRDLENLYKDLKVVQNQFSGNLVDSIALLKETKQFLNNLFLPVKNLNQDLLTLKFLLTNIKISNSSSNQSKLTEIESLLKRYNEVINDFKVCSFQNETNLEQLKDHTSKTLQVFEQVFEKNLQDLDAILNNIHFGIILFAEKREEVTRQIPEFKNQTTSSSSSIADIITNLQYHDIIRQKMEHVHSNHKKLLDELEAIDKEVDDNSLSKNQKLLLRIRDLANLQSAQLVYANKEYQQAIEIITNKFIAIGNDMTTISKMCNEINLSQGNSEELHLQQLVEKLQSSAGVLTKFLKANQNFTSHIDGLSSQINNTSKSISKYSDSIKKLKDVTSETIALLSSNTLSKEVKGSIKQVEDLFSDVEKFEGIIRSGFSKIENSGNNIFPDISKTLNQSKNEGLFTQAASSMNEIIYKLNNKNSMIKSLLEDNFSISKTISIDVQDSIGKIRYYDFFEKVIIDIIGEFNHIYQMLRTEVEDEQVKSDLEEIKSIYTMASEHKIHDKVSKGELDLFTEDDNKETVEDDDNLELF